MALAVVTVIGLAQAAPARPQPAEVVRLWPGAPPGTEKWSGAEVALDADLPNSGKVHILTNVTVPTLTIVGPPPGKGIGTAMLIAPGGAFRALTWDLEGLETARWLASQGITAFILKYRVRTPPDGPAPKSFDDFLNQTAPAREIAAADIRQAIRLIRSGASGYDIDPHHVGVIGFSAGAIALMSVLKGRDHTDQPDFAVAMYGAMPSHADPDAGAPPLFIVAAQDDPEVSATRSAEMFDAWTRSHAPAELHLYERGGHGFGIRPHHRPIDDWPNVLKAWMASRGLLQRAPAQP